MDAIRAERMTKELTGKEVGGWSIRSFIGAGKSAIVFLSEKDGRQAALKVFDAELVERFGKKTQLARIDRERVLIGETHPNLVQIFDGGECSESGYLFVAMQYLKGRNLEDALLDVPRDRIAPLLAQVASAVIFLEKKQLAHRDIKPSNIAVTDDYEKAILLDLGVLRPFGEPGLTDDEARHFIGTHRYGSPEFLIRAERDTMEGWRAISFYQLGGVLHDLIMRKPLFHEFAEPIAVLVEAVKSEQPQIHAEDVSPDLVLLAQNCLLKSAEARLELVTWDDFTQPSSRRQSVESARERVRKRSLAARAASTVPATAESTLTPAQMARQIADTLDRIIRQECAGSASFPRMEIIPQIGEPTTVQVIFATAPALSLPRRLSIRLSCRLVDESTLAVQINASACLLNDGGNMPRL